MAANQAADCVGVVVAGPWSAQQANDLVMGINANVGGGFKKTQVRDKQEVNSFQKYLTQSEMDKLKDPTLTTTGKLDVIIHRMFAIGPHPPSEPCVAGILSNFGIVSVQSKFSYVCMCSWKVYLNILFTVIATKPSTIKEKHMHAYVQANTLDRTLTCC